MCGFFSSEMSAQTVNEKYVDSILQLAQKEDAPTKRELYQGIGGAILRYNSSADATNLYEYALRQDSSNIVKLNLYDTYSKVLSRAGKMDDAIILKEKAIELTKEFEDNGDFVFFKISLANSYLFKNMPDKALQHLNDVEEAAIEKHKKYLPNLYYNKALMHIALKDYEKTKMCYLQLFDAVKDYENNAQKRFAIYTIVDFYSEMKNPMQLAKFTEILANLYEEAHPNTPAGHMPIKSIFEKRLQPENIPKFKEAIRISDSLNSITSFVYSTIDLAQTFSSMGQGELAIPYLRAAAKKLDVIEKPSH